MTKLNQKEYWEILRKRRDPRHKVIEAFVRPKLAYIKAVIFKRESSKLSELSLLDVGCGNGFFTYYFEKLLDATGLDFSQLMLSMNPCRKKVCGSAMDLPFRDNCFDIVFCSNLLHHMEDPKSAVSEMKRVSKHYIIISEPNRNNPLMFLFGLIKKSERGTLKMSSSYLEKLVGQVNLDVISAQQLGSVLPNKTPETILPLLKVFDGKYPLSFSCVIISEKREQNRRNATCVYSFSRV